MGVKGFTLGEILITTVILGIVAGLAMPVYGTMMESNRANEAKTSLYVVLMAEKIYKLNSASQVYWGPGGTTAASINAALNVELMPQNYDTSWSVTQSGSVAAATFTASVCRGNSGNKCFQINQAGTLTESGAY